MPKMFEEEEEVKDIIINRSKTIPTISIISNDEIRNRITKKRTELNLTTLQLNQKCKFIYKYTIRDIESGKTISTLTERRAIEIALGISLN